MFLSGAVAGSGQPGAKEQLLVKIRGMLHVITLPTGLESGALAPDAPPPPLGPPLVPVTIFSICLLITGDS